MTLHTTYSRTQTFNSCFLFVGGSGYDTTHNLNSPCELFFAKHSSSLACVYSILGASGLFHKLANKNEIRVLRERVHHCQGWVRWWDGVVVMQRSIFRRWGPKFHSSNLQVNGDTLMLCTIIPSVEFSIMHRNNNYLFRHFLCVLCRNSVGQSDCSIQINLLLHDKPCQLSRETAAHVLSAMKENTYFWCRWPIFWSPRGPLSHILTQFYGEVGTKQQWRSYNHNMLWVGSTLFNNN